MTRTQTLTRVERDVYGFAGAVIVVGIALSFINLDFFENRYAVEDGPVQWLTVIGFTLGGLLCLKRAITLRGHRPLHFLVLTALLGLFLLFCAGEEISWGQRLFGVETPEWLAEHNAQKETNLHNLKVGEVKLNKLVFTWGIGIVGLLYFAVLSPWYGNSESFADRVDALAIPVPKTHHIIAVGIMLVLTQVATASTNKGEMAEFGGALIFLLILLYPTNGDNFKVVASSVDATDDSPQSA